MGMHVRIRLPPLKKILRPDLAPLNLHSFQCLFAASERRALLSPDNAMPSGFPGKKS